jgi:predicted flap endonuclease-1-like 5' DNA nuclease
MPYTVTKLFLWGIPLVLVGGLVGWLLRSLQCRAEIARFRAGVAHTPPATPVVGAAAVETAPAGDDLVEAGAGVAAEVTAAAGAESTTDQPAGIEPTSEATVHEPDHEAEASIATLVAMPDTVELDLDAAAAVLGRAIGRDDLTVVEGIGPKIAELLAGIGVRTWAELAAADVGVLRTMLQDAGPRFAMHDPSTWPQQARLLATGSWAEFAALTEQLDGGRGT